MKSEISATFVAKIIALGYAFFVCPDENGVVLLFKFSGTPWSLQVSQRWFSAGWEEGLWSLITFFRGHSHFDNPIACGGIKRNLTEDDVIKLAKEFKEYAYSHNS